MAGALKGFGKIPVFSRLLLPNYACDMPYIAARCRRVSTIVTSERK